MFPELGFANSDNLKVYIFSTFSTFVEVKTVDALGMLRCLAVQELLRGGTKG